MDKKYGRKSLEDFLRYLEGGLTDKERHKIERELLADPFEDEAMEGLSGIGADEARQDLDMLERQIRRRAAPKQTRIWYRVAAAVAILLVVTITFVTVFNDRIMWLNRNIAETETQPEQKVMEEQHAAEQSSTPEKLNAQEEPGVREAPSPREEIPEQVEAEEEAAGGIEPGRNEIAGRESAGETVGTDEPAESLAYEVDKVMTGPENVQEQEIAEQPETPSLPEFPEVSADYAVQPIAAAKSRQMEFAAGDFNDDSNNFPVTGRTLQTGMVSPGVMTVVDYGVSPGSRTAGALSVSEIARAGDETDYRPAEPETGRKAFNEYVLNHLRFPEGSDLDSTVVILNFTAGLDGQPGKINVLESPGELFSEEAIRLLKEGPRWEPAIKNGQKYEQVVRVRILFRR